MGESQAGRDPDVSDDELLSALASVTDPTDQPVAAAGDVAAEVSIKRDAVLKRLDTLAGSGPVESMKRGRSRLFWLPPDDERQTRLDELEEEAEEEQPEEYDGPGVVESEDGETVAVDQLVADLWTWLEDRPPQKSHARQAVANVFRRLLEEGGRPIQTAELKEVVYQAAGEQYKNERAAWESVRRYLSDLPGVESTGGGEWSVDLDAAKAEVAR